MSIVNLTLEAHCVPGHEPYERGRALASELITLAVHAMRAEGTNDPEYQRWIDTTVEGIRIQINEALNTSDLSAVAGMVLHLSLAASRLCELAAVNLRDEGEEPSEQAVDALLQKLLAVLEQEAVNRGLGSSE